MQRVGMGGSRRRCFRRRAREIPARRIPEHGAEEAGLTLEMLAFESEAPRGTKGFSKGHLSSLEKGLVMPTVATLKMLADRLGVLVADLVAVPDDGEREAILDATRKLPKGALKRLASEVAAKKPSRSR